MVVDIWKACHDGELDLVRIILREGQDINEQTHEYMNTPLHIAAANGHYLIVKYLVEAGANPILTNKKGQTPLNYADEFFSNGLDGNIVIKTTKRAMSAKILSGVMHKQPSSSLI